MSYFAHNGHGALTDECDGYSVGMRALACDAEGGVGRIEVAEGAMNYARGLALPLALCILVLAGCSTPHGLVGNLPSLPDPDQAAEIIVIREFRFLGGAGDFGVVLDGVLLYGISTDERVVIKVPPGDHVVGVSARGPGKDEASVAVRAEARQRYYFRIETGSPYHPGPFLYPTAPAAAEALIAKTRQVK